VPARWLPFRPTGFHGSAGDRAFSTATIHIEELGTFWNYLTFSDGLLTVYEVA